MLQPRNAIAPNFREPHVHQTAIVDAVAGEGFRDALVGGAGVGVVVLDLVGVVFGGGEVGAVDGEAAEG